MDQPITSSTRPKSILSNLTSLFKKQGLTRNQGGLRSNLVTSVRRDTGGTSELGKTRPLTNIKITRARHYAEDKHQTAAATKRITFRDDLAQSEGNQTQYGVTSEINRHESSAKFKNILQRQQRAKARSQHQTNRKDMAYIVKEAQFYFEKNPTYLKEIEVGEIQNMELKKYVEIQGPQRNPVFGFSHIAYDDEEGQSPEAARERMLKFKLSLIGSQHKKSPGKHSPASKAKDLSDSEEDGPQDNPQENILPFQRALDWKRKDDRIFNHIMKCFTFGKKIKRQLEDDADRVSRVEILKKRFQRLSLLREYFSVENRNRPRKFKYPVCEDGKQIEGDPFQLYDELQYCEESDLEEPRTQRKRGKRQKVGEERLDERSEALDIDYIDNHRRYDSKLIKHLAQHLTILEDGDPQPDKSPAPVSDSDDTMEGLSESESICSTPRRRAEKELLQYDRLMPFDFYTHRKAKKFFKEPIVDIDKLLKDFGESIKHKDLNGKSKQRGQVGLNTSSRGTGRNTLQKEKIYFDENEDAKLREVPEMNDDLREMYQVNANPLKLQTATLKTPNSIGSQSYLAMRDQNLMDTQSTNFDTYKYTSRVQASQLRNAYSELQGFAFQRTQNRSFAAKREILEKIVSFKQSIRPQQIQALKSRQFVIVDINPPQQQKAKKVEKRATPITVGLIVPKEKEIDQIQEVKVKIMREKDKRIKAKIAEQIAKSKPSVQQRSTSNERNLSQILAYSISNQLWSKQNLQTASPTPALTTLPSRFQLPVVLQPQLTPDPPFPAQVDVPQDFRVLLDSSPYADILTQPDTFGLGPNEQPPRKPRKFVLDKLKRRSILNCEIFKETRERESKPKTLFMTEKIAQIISMPMQNVLSSQRGVPVKH